MTPTDEDYARLLEFRTAIRRFLHWSEQEAERVGLTPAQHQLLLCIRGFGAPEGPTIGDVAELLVLKHHSAVELVDRAERAGLVRRVRDANDQRVVRLKLSATAKRKLNRLSVAHKEEITRLGPAIRHFAETPGSAG